MATNTDATSNAPITDEPADENVIAEDEQVLDGDEQVGSEQVEAQDEQQGDEVAPSRGERREQNYIDKLSEQIRNSSSLTGRNNGESSRDDYQPIKYEEGDYDPTQLEEDRTKYGTSQYQRGRQEAEQAIDPIQTELWLDRLEIDSERAAKFWDVLDETSENFDETFAKEMTQKYLNFIGFKMDGSGKMNVDRRNVRYTDFVKAERQNIERFATRVAEQSRKNVASQAGRTGIRPTGNSRSSTRSKVDLSDPNWMNKLSREEWDEWGRDLADEQINKALNIK